MKKLIALLIMNISMTGYLAQASANTVINISNTDMISLQTNKSEMSLAVSYPGSDISGVCGVEIRADSYNRHQSIANLLSAIKVVNNMGVDPVVSIQNEMTILMDLRAAKWGYGTWFSIHTKNGKSLKEVILETLGENRTVVLVGVSCTKDI
ncbi:MAG: hypothetical protein V4596_11105 [Bdellovibrionota bacterium]